MGEHVFDADLSVSAKALDSLMEPTGVIAEAQQMAAKAFGARKTFFATKRHLHLEQGDPADPDRPGENCCSIALPQIGPSRRGAVGRRSPLPMDSSVTVSTGCSDRCPRATILRAISEHPDAQASGADLVHLRRCARLKPVIDAAHASGIRC